MMSFATLSHQQQITIYNEDYNIEQELLEAPRPKEGCTSNIVGFYTNRSVLITGASGFVGKVLIEKLLRACPSIDQIFVLIRPKWNKTPEERLHEVLKVPLFNGVRDKLGAKVVLVGGDVTQPNLGLNQDDSSKITNKVSVVFHCAATVKFDEPLKQSTAVNLRGTKNMIELCRQISHLAALVHVSTAYANCDRHEIDEHIYPVETMDPEKLIQMADWLDEDTVQVLKSRLLGARPNTYTYTKASAEWLLVRSARDLPVVVCRPSIVVASRREPFKGWIDNLNGPTGIILGAGNGLIRSIIGENNCVADLVPVDMVVNLIVALGWFAHINENLKHSDKSGKSTARSPSSDCELKVSALSDKNNIDIRHPKHDPVSNSAYKQDEHSNEQLSSPLLACDYVDGKCLNHESMISSSAEVLEPKLLDNNQEEQNCQPEMLQSSVDDCTDVDNRQRPLKDSITTNNKFHCKLEQFVTRNKAELSKSILTEEYGDIPVFHCTSGGENPITWGKLCLLIVAALIRFPSKTTYRYPNMSFTNNSLLDSFYRFTLHYIPAYIVDYLTKLFNGKSNNLVKMYGKLDKNASVFRTFTTKQWKFNYDNRVFLYEQIMNDEDRRLFDIDVKQLNWKQFATDYSLGVRKFMLKEPMDNLKEARFNLKKTYYRNLSLQILFVLVITFLCIYYLWH